MKSLVLLCLVVLALADPEYENVYAYKKNKFPHLQTQMTMRSSILLKTLFQSLFPFSMSSSRQQDNSARILSLCTNLLLKTQSVTWQHYLQLVDVEIAWMWLNLPNIITAVLQ
ncbi:hypothetical protein P9112_009109 [Eukaryota sp. TZLM1-RC]